MKVFDFLKPVRLIVLSALIFCCSLAAYAQGDAKLLTGRVTDTQGQPLIGASVLIKGDINNIVSQYTIDEIKNNQSAVQDEILKDLQKMFGSDFIVAVGFPTAQYQ